MNRQTIHSRSLKAYRRKHKCTISELAQATGIHFDLLTKWSMGMSLIPPKMICKILTSIDMTEIEFLKLGANDASSIDEQIRGIRSSLGLGN